MRARTCSECGAHAPTTVYGRRRWLRGRPRRRVCMEPRCIERAVHKVLGLPVPTGNHRV